MTEKWGEVRILDNKKATLIARCSVEQLATLSARKVGNDKQFYLLKCLCNSETCNQNAGVCLRPAKHRQVG